MNDDEIKQVIFRILSQIAPEADLGALAQDENIRQTLDIDSFDALTFFVQINEHLGISVPEADYGKLNTLREMLGYFRSRVK